MTTPSQGFTIGLASGAIGATAAKSISMKWIGKTSFLWSILISVFIVTVMNLLMGYGDFIKGLFISPVYTIIDYWILIPFLVIARFWGELKEGTVFVGVLTYTIILYWIHGSSATMLSIILPLVVAAIITLLLAVIIYSAMKYIK